MAFKKKIQKNRNVAELPRFESPDVAFQNFPAATLVTKIGFDICSPHGQPVEIFNGQTFG